MQITIRKFKENKYYVFSCFCILIVFAYFQMNHSFWEDESQAYLIARDSKGLVDLLNAVRYEITPPLYHLVLFFGNKVYHSIEILKFFNFLFFAVIILTVSYLPIKNTSVKFLFLSSYVIFYEFGIINRSYLMGVCLLLIGIYIFTDRNYFKNKQYVIFFVCGLCSLSNAHSLIISGCLAFLTLIRLYRLKQLIDVKVIFSFITFVVFLIASMYFLAPKSDRLENTFKTKKNKQYYFNQVFTSVQNMGTGFVYVQRSVADTLNIGVWQNSVIKNKFTEKKIYSRPIFSYLLFSAGLFIFSLSLFLIGIKNILAFTFYLITSCCLFIADILSDYGYSIRHCFFYIIALFIAYTICLYRSKYLNFLIVALLVISTYSNVAAIYNNANRPFCNAHTCANYLRYKQLHNRFNLEDMGGRYWHTQSLVSYLGISGMYVPEADKKCSYIKLDTTLELVKVADSIMLRKCVERKCSIIIHYDSLNTFFKRYNYVLDTFISGVSMTNYEKYFIYKKKN